MKLEPGQRRGDEKALKKDELRAELMQQAESPPIVLAAEDYAIWLEHTVLARLERGENALDKVRTYLAVRRDKTSEDPDPDVVRLLDEATVAFQYAALKFNIMYRPTIDGRSADNVILWPRADVSP
jgi:hypothetical protein